MWSTALRRIPQPMRHGYPSVVLIAHRWTQKDLSPVLPIRDSTVALAERFTWISEIERISARRTDQATLRRTMYLPMEQWWLDSLRATPVGAVATYRERAFTWEWESHRPPAFIRQKFSAMVGLSTQITTSS